MKGAGMSFLNWEEYLTPSGGVETCRMKCRDSFKNQRERIRKLHKKRNPDTVVCLGSGCLNDIPVDDFVKSGCSIFLVDWIKGISREAYLHDVVSMLDGESKCNICSVQGNQHDYCKKYYEIIQYYRHINYDIRGFFIHQPSHYSAAQHHRCYVDSTFGVVGVDPSWAIESGFKRERQRTIEQHRL